MPEITTVLHQCLDEAGEILMKHYGKIESVDKKSDIDLVTIADRESEARIKAIITAAFPTHQILAEETGEDYTGKSDTYRWIIDPVDGTTNFAHSFPQFSVSIAVEHKGEIVAGGVLNPYYKERFFAERGSGATLNGAPICVSKVPQLSESLLVTGFPYDRSSRVDHYLSIVGDFMKRAHGILRLGSAALDLCAVACGRLEGFWEEKLHPWDTAAGWLIVEEAGGRVTNFTGGPFSPYAYQTLATNGRIHDDCLQVLAGRFKTA
ncbi:MAG: inositol monophosphatase [Candidatus Sumerlaeaceae bacterium]|nr:inositol monophosphatase [Candidatus Sumerlaeaceae bacterium]